MRPVNVLALDTSTNSLSLALLQDGTVICEASRDVKTGHAGIILKVIDEMLIKGGMKREAVGLIAVGTGPGSFTGLRIGIATAKGLASALGCPMAGVPSLDVIAQAALPSPMQIMPVIDAKKRELFCAVYAKDGSRLTGFMNLKPEAAASLINEDTLLLGNGCSLYRDILSEMSGGFYHEGPADLWNPKAAVLAGIALEKSVDTFHDEVQPIYVRASDATLLLERSGKCTANTMR